MASTFDLNNVFVYYIWAINPAQEFSDMLSVLLSLIHISEPTRPY